LPVQFPQTVLRHNRQDYLNCEIRKRRRRRSRRRRRRRRRRRTHTA
jgi:hypothetical protein